MKQFYVLITLFLLTFYIPETKAQIVEFSYDITSEIPGEGNGNAGIVFINNQFWVSKWADSNIHLFDVSGNYIETFQVSGITGTRSFTTNGTSVFCGTSNSNIYEINPTTRTLINTISISTTSSANTVRMCAYDASLNDNAGGFWISNFDTDIISVDMSGNQLSVIPSGTHGVSSMYGGAIDGDGHLIIYNQGGSNGDQISILDLSTGTVLGDSYDVFTNVTSPIGSTSSIAGGMFFSDEIIPGQGTLVGISQASPSNILFGLNLEELLSVEDFKETNKISLYPNPSSHYINISGLKSQVAYEVYDTLGAQILKGNVSAGEAIDIQNLTSGIYFLTLESGNTMKFIKE